MRSAHDVPQVRAAEAGLMATLLEGALMERAAYGLAAAVVDTVGGAYGLRVVLLVGSGDNGGDALLAGAFLARRGARVDALLVAPQAHPHTGTLRAAGGRIHRLVEVRGDAHDAAVGDGPTHDVVDIDDLLHAAWWQRADVVIDGIVGIGGSGGLREPAASAVACIPIDAVVVAVDLPSGVDAGTGAVVGDHVIADLTVSMGTYKPGLLVHPGAAASGRIRLVDIGLAPWLPTARVEALQVVDVLARLPWPAVDADKYSRGAVGIVAGSVRYPGAAVLAAAGAVRGGAGYVRCIAPPTALDAVRAGFPEVVGHPVTDATASEAAERALDDAGRVQAYVVGPGMGTGPEAESLLVAALGRDVPVLIDADALTVLTGSTAAREAVAARAGAVATLLTPHAGELARLLGIERSDVEADPLSAALQGVEQLQATVLLKGPTTLVADIDPERPLRVNPTGTPWLGSAGTGDVLAGLAGVLLAAGADALEAGSTAAFVHGLAGQIASGGEEAPVRALDVADAIPEAFEALASTTG